MGVGRGLVTDWCDQLPLASDEWPRSYCFVHLLLRIVFLFCSLIKINPVSVLIIQVRTESTNC